MPRWDTQRDAAARWRQQFPQCEAIGKQIPRRCLRRAVEGGLCLQHALLNGYVGTPSMQTRGYAYKKHEQPQEQLISLVEELEKVDRERMAFLKEQNTKAWLHGELEKWIDSCGGWDKAKKICQLLWPENPAYR